MGAASIAAWTLILNSLLFYTLAKHHYLRLTLTDEAQGVGDFGISINAGSALGKDITVISDKRVMYRQRSHIEDPIQVTNINPTEPPRALQLTQAGSG